MSTILMTCKGCGAQMNVSSKYAGRKGRCKQCQTSCDIPNYDKHEQALDEQSSYEQASHHPLPPELPSEVNPMIPCYYCAEMIPQRAKKCRHCGEVVDLSLREVRAKQDSKNDLLDIVALILTVFFPGLGHIIRGQVGTGVGWFVGVVAGTLAFVIPGLIVWVLCIVDISRQIKSQQ